MIKSILIKNFILIDFMELNFDKGFNVFLGETGAGKSIIIKSIDTVLGAKISKDVLKDNKIKGLIEITFDDNGEELIISREISTTGTKCRINGVLVSIDEIKKERERLIDIHTQFETYTYMSSKNHIKLLDSYITMKDESFCTQLNEQEIEFKRYKEAKTLLEKINEQSSSNKERLDLLRFQVDEIEKAEIEENEEEELNKELEILSNVQELKELSYGVHFTLGGEDNSILEAMSKIGYNISKIKDFDPNMKEVEENFYNSLEILRDVNSTLRSYSDSLEDNPQRLDEINERLELIQKLKRKYGDIFEAYEKFKNELETLEKENISSKDLEEEIESLLVSMEKLSTEIEEKRKLYAKELSEKIIIELKKLEFEYPNFQIEVRETELNAKGKNDIEFMLTTNLSKSLSPLVKSASGGEISRIMLALKTVFALSDKVSTVIFDEIDTGISGKTSCMVAEEIKELSKTKQVFAITHQPIIAAKSNGGYWISKSQKDGVTNVLATKLDENKKIEALAQLSSGVINEQSLSFAKELLLKN